MLDEFRDLDDEISPKMGGLAPPEHSSPVVIRLQKMMKIAA